MSMKQGLLEKIKTKTLTMGVCGLGYTRLCQDIGTRDSGTRASPS